MHSTGPELSTAPAAGPAPARVGRRCPRWMHGCTHCTQCTVGIPRPPHSKVRRIRTCTTTSVCIRIQLGGAGTQLQHDGVDRPRLVGSAAHSSELVIQPVELTYEGYTYKHSQLAYIPGRGPRPVVLIHPNYAGLKQFDIDQAAFIAQCGYVGFALDLYKEVAEGETVADGPTGPTVASVPYRFGDRNPIRDRDTQQGRENGRRHFAGAFEAMNGQLRNPKHWRGLMRAYLDVAFAHPAVESGKAAAIGYCFGGQCCLEQVRDGQPLQACVALHGLLHSRPTRLDDPLNPMVRISQEEYAAQIFEPSGCVNTYDTECKVLIENGDLDAEVPQDSIDEWKAEMDANGIDWRLNNVRLLGGKLLRALLLTCACACFLSTQGLHTALLLPRVFGRLPTPRRRIGALRSACSRSLRRFGPSTHSTQSLPMRVGRSWGKRWPPRQSSRTWPVAFCTIKRRAVL
eukprot:COSAG03_NODE_439_length_7918_cov_13.498785_10_plen_458_part_00